MGGGIAGAQSLLPTGALDQFNQVVGSRIEAVNILGGDYAAAGGFYTFSGGDSADLNITKLGGSGAVTPPKPLDLWGLSWAPILQGNLGIVSAQNTYKSGFLAGNQMNYDTLARGGGRRRSLLYQRPPQPVPHHQRHLWFGAEQVQSAERQRRAAGGGRPRHAGGLDHGHMVGGAVTGLGLPMEVGADDLRFQFHLQFLSHG